MKKAYVTVFTILSIAAGSILTLSQSGGTFVIQRSAIVASGERVAGGTFTLDGTAGQPFASTSSGGTFQVGGGFWGGGAQAAAFSVSGRVFTSVGASLRNAVVSITNNRTLAIQTTLSLPNGNFQFTNIAADDIYTISVSSKRYRFDVQQVLVNGDLTNIIFVGNN